MTTRFSLTALIDAHNEKVFYVNPISGNVLTYAQTRQLAETFVAVFEHQRPSGNVVFIRLSQPHHMIPALLACWHLQLSPAILDPETSSDRLVLLASLLACNTVICDADLPEGVGNGPEPMRAIRIDQSKDLPIGTSPSLNVSIDPSEQPAIILFSSGTTGVPKCVPLSIDNLASNITALKELIQLSENDVFLCSSPFWYAHGLFNSFITAFFLGAKLIYPGILNVMNASKALKAASDLGATVYHITPSMLPILSMMGGRTKGPLPSFRYVISGTSRLEADDKRKFEEIYDVPVSQQYGMTESLIMTLNYQKQTELVSSVGVPFGCQMEIRDGKGTPVAPGSIGEIAVKTDAAFGEYYHQPEETRAAYRDGWFYTGDLGYLDSDGYLTVTGRKKEMIKRGGFNISPLEINRVLLGIDGVQEAATVGIEDNVYGEEVYAFVSGQLSLSEEQILRLCAEQMAKTHVPKRIFVVDALPKTVSGKIAVVKLKELAAQLIKA